MKRRKVGGSRFFLTLVVPLITVIFFLFHQARSLSEFLETIATRFKELGLHIIGIQPANNSSSNATTTDGGTFGLPLSTTTATELAELPHFSQLKVISPSVMDNDNTITRRSANNNDSEERSLTSYFVVNNIMTTSEPVNSSCQRTCVDFRNKIYYSPPVGDPGAGLIDRLTIFGTLLNMAGYLCARVYAPRPKFLLGARHNFNQTLDASMSWSEFGDYVLWNDPKRQPALLDWDNPDDLNEWPDLFNTTDSTTAGMFHHSVLPRQVKVQLPMFARYTSLQQQRFMNNNTDPQTSDYFIWVMEAEYYDWSNLLSYHLRHRPPPKNDKQALQRFREPYIFATGTLYFGCQYAKVELNANLQHLREQVIHQLTLQQQHQHQAISTRATATTVVKESSPLQPPPLVGYFHIRRQDAVIECDTSLQRMEAYLKCSLGEAITRLSSSAIRSTPRNVIVLFSSDDDDPQYRRHILQQIEQQQRTSDVKNKNAIHVTAVDLDELVKRTLRTEIQSNRTPAFWLNNFHIFQLVFSIGYNRTVVKFQLEQRRERSCDTCTNVTDQLIKLGVLSGIKVR
jgi:hypothetical protein